MKHYYEVDGQRRYYIAKKISKKENKESFLKILYNGTTRTYKIY